MPDCYLVIGQVGSPTSADQTLHARLGTLGYTVTYRDDTSSAPSGVDLVVISASCSGSSAPGGTYKTYAGPVVSCESFAHDDMDWCTGVSFYSGTQIDVVDDTHDIAVAAGLSNGLVSVYSTADILYTNTGLGAGAEVIAERPSSSTATVYAYDVDGFDAGGLQVPNRRVALPLFFEAADPPVAADGWALFDAAVGWADEDTGGGAATVPSVEAGGDTAVTVSTEFARTAVENDGGATITAREWSVQSGPAEVGNTLSTAAAVSWTPTTLGSYVLEYEATNSVGVGSDTATVDVVAADVPVEVPEGTPVTQADRVALVEAVDLDVSVELVVLDDEGRHDTTIPVDSCKVRHDVAAKVHRSVELSTSAVLDWPRVRVCPVVTVEGGGFNVSQPLGVFTLTDPQPDSQDPPTYSVAGFDLLYTLDQRLSAPVAYPAGQPVIGAAGDILAQHGFETNKIDDARSGDTLPEPRVWTVEFDGTYLDVVNDLLAMVGYESLWMTAAGEPTSGPKLTASERPVVWRYDAQSPSGIVFADGRSVESNFADAPNLWLFWRTDVDRDDAPTDGDGLYRYLNDSEGPASVDARGGLVVRSRSDGPVEATSQADLETNGNAIVAAEIEGVTIYRWTSDVNPFHGHQDVVEAVDRGRGVAGRFALMSWELDPVERVMAHEAHAISGGVIDA